MLPSLIPLSKHLHDIKNKNPQNHPFIMPKTQEKQQTINEILSSLNPTQKETLQNLRQLIKDTAPETIEMVKQGKIVYKLENKDLVWISRYQNHLDVEFAMGTSLSSDLLKSRGIAEQNKNTRHVLVGNLALVKPELTRLVHEAATLGFEHCN
ncbi:DUF1801 domain-containing protein [Candidatus Bathycorpusculum sp.]|uniref:DUF1801 domain-containing protein n=1 Tax=Candidatus Bathycorpusculum sp. TaxID=2994959 RepID=UPI00283144C5|nr:DUF1801 domain-containing protein [Candidatus Termitimicrobium sp.]MCL2430999.1 DUF1801 domain-containing protein [Candidatus Termitimicrobium sp.]